MSQLSFPFSIGNYSYRPIKFGRYEVTRNDGMVMAVFGNEKAAIAYCKEKTGFDTLSDAIEYFGRKTDQ